MAQIAVCPKCAKAIDDTQSDTWCINCGEPLPKDIRERLPRVAAAALAAARAVEATASNRSGSPAVNRYKDAYRVGSALVGLGNGIKIAGAAIAGLLVLVSMSIGGAFALGGFVIGAIAGGLFWVFGVLVAAQGQILQATLDTAVGSSHFLTDAQRAEAMGLPSPVADRASP